ncbi:DUF262 domain-containing protein [Agrobacterium tumefaciens]|uniref:DUF262 domain-containing protein n=1 Tax=Agrobacterium tumefaciens TaxID=358 RepID=UPI0015733931|nr:DUF262 domain-containing protein [Agrobacterium tumefaciens]NSZ85227.1 DUF262 domain-containing protein [Agrobacterium tumefaciens]WCA70478.1 DUF262 domain-containing protein [Agrobacterium tumefaciens]
MLSAEIEDAQRSVKTDAYQMSIGEIVTMYDDKEIVIDPDFQRMFRWEVGQKSKLIESLLLGIPLPSIFVFEKNDGTWELIDGLQRISTILEFMGKLREENGDLRPPSVLEATKYLPSLHNGVWEKSERLEYIPMNEQAPIDKSHQIAIRRARIGVEILKRPSDDQTKFDLFQRLNAGGTQANAQELRNCVMLMVNKNFFAGIKVAAESAQFQKVTNISEDQASKQRHMELAVRFLVHTNVPYDGKLDVEEYIDEGIISLAIAGDRATAVKQVTETFDLLDKAAGGDALRRWENNHPSGKIGLVALEGIAVGIAKNLDRIKAKQDPVGFVRDQIKSFWVQDGVKGLTAPGMRGTTRIQRTVPFGEEWFAV